MDGFTMATQAEETVRQIPPALSGFPPPPMTRVRASKWNEQGKQTVVLMPDGTKLSGRLSEFRLDRGAVSLESSNGEPEATIYLKDVKLVRVVVDKCWQPSDDDDDDRSVRTFDVAFVDGDSLKGRTRGFRRDSKGLYLYHVFDSNRCFCTFVPNSMIANVKVGPLMGEMLVSEGALERSKLDLALKDQDSSRTRPVGETLIERAVVTTEELEAALQRQNQSIRSVRIGELLIGEGLISEKQLGEALDLQKTVRGKLLGEILVERKFVSRSDLQSALARKLGIPTVDLRKCIVDTNAVKRVPEHLVRKHRVLPLYVFDQRLVVATENPLDWVPIDAIAFAANMHVDPVIAPLEEIDRVIDMVFNMFSEGSEQIDVDLTGYTGEDEGSEDDSLSERQYGDNVVVNLVNQIIGKAYSLGASDIHVEPNKKHKSLVRIRKDGIMSVLLEVPPKLRRAVVGRIKVMAGLNIAEHRIPQDGRINLRRFTSLDVELRVATMPTMGGIEDVVMRVLKKQQPVPVNGLDLSARNERWLLDGLKKTHGMFLVTGPTGSGKTTTLHSLLAHVNDGQNKIWTAEDPVEISQPGLRQMQINSKVGLDFARALRAMLRADPDVIMVGEMRDSETAAVAIEASLTGHLVFSTLHTNTAPDTAARLLDMGMDPFNFSDALIGILSQRLARRLCAKCRVPYIPDEKQLLSLAAEFLSSADLKVNSNELAERCHRTVERWRSSLSTDNELTLYRAEGCESCEGSGYKSRFALHELMMADDSIRRLIHTRAPTVDVRFAAMARGMRTLRQDGVEKVIQGITDMKEIRRVCAA